jgi:hypothetical protein
MSIISIAIIVFILNIPFGYWRANTKKFSLQWVLAIHVPVLLMIGLRIISGLGFQLYTFPIMVGVFFTGQYLGGKIFTKMKFIYSIPVTSCLCIDIFRLIINQ